MEKTKFDLSDLEELETSNKPFRISSKRIHLTYKSHIDIDELILHINSLSETYKVFEYSGCQEVGKTDYSHTHLGIEFDNRPDIKSSRFFDFDDIHPNIKKIASKEHWINVLKYHMKQPVTFKTNRVIGTDCSKKKSRNQSDTFEIATVETALSYKNAKEAIRGLNDIKLIGGIELAFKYKDEDHGPEATNIYWLPWQKKLKDEIFGKPHNRRIIWYCDLAGNSGKSLFAEHAQVYWKNVLVLSYANPREATMAFHTAKQKGYDINTVIIDL